MLSAAHRLRRSADFAAAFRGSRGGAHRLIVSFRYDPADHQTDLHSTKVGFVVSKRVGNSVVRHRLYRQLRHLMRERIDLFPAGAIVAIRVLPSAKDATSVELGSDLDIAIGKALHKWTQGGGVKAGTDSSSTNGKHE